MDAHWLSPALPRRRQYVACTFRESSKKVMNWIMQLLTAVGRKGEIGPSSANICNRLENTSGFPKF